MKVHKGFYVVLACFFALFIFATEGYSYTIDASAGPGGTISPFGAVPVNAGADQTFTITPDLEYGILDVLVDGLFVGPVPSYTFTNVTADHSITASFTCANPVMLQGDGSYFDTIMAAYNYATINLGLNNFTLMLTAGTLIEQDLRFNQGTIILDGGYDCSFADNSMMTKIAGSLTITGGTVIPSNIVLSAAASCQLGDPDNFPGNPEICDCLDNNCNGLVDDGLTFDVDGDGYSAIGSCSGSADDCNDNNTSIHPYGEIYGDGIDQDCDGIDVLPSEVGCFDCHDVYDTDYVHTLVEIPVAACGDCHNERDSSVRTGHYGQTVRTAGNNMAAGSVIRCNSCHDQVSVEHNFGANIVWAKVEAYYAQYGTVTCYTCHETLTVDHETGNAHDNRTIDSLCGQCHTSDTTTLGSPGTGTLVSDEDVFALHRSDCALCHAYTGTKVCVQTVEQAIQDGLDGTQISCTDCHSAHHSAETNQVSYNPSVDTSQPAQQGCAVCHNDYDTVNGTSLGLSTWETILVEHDLDGTKDGSANACGSCHAYDGSSSAPLAAVQNAIASGNPATCATCHTDKVPDIAHGAPTSGKHPEHLAMAGINSCSTCHSNPPYFQSGTDANGDGLYDLAETDVCNPCHQDWDPAGLPAEQDYKAGWSIAGFTLECTDCHGEPVDNGDIYPVGGRRAVTGEFPASSHAHYGTVLDSTSCQVCHDYTNHADGTVNLPDPDGGAGYNFVYATELVSDPDLSNFCANCHDDNGATRLVLPLDPLDPFANGNAPPDVATRFMGTLQWNEYYGDFCFGYEGSQRPVNSHHDISDADQAFSGAKIECINCHGAHTSAATQKVTNPFDSNVAWTGTQNEFCLACHNGGHGPTEPIFPADVTVPAFYTPPPVNIPGESCGTNMVYDCADNCVAQANVDTALTNNSCDDVAGLNLDCNIFSFDNGDCLPVNAPNTSCGTDMVYDCADNCVAQATVNTAATNGTCDEAAGLDLNCAEFNYDYNSCNPCIGNDCSYIGGIDSCSYDFNPWWIDVSWTNEAHGGDSKRDWVGYSGAPTVPEMDCVACHDSHGSYDAVTNPGGNPYMLRDYVDGTQFIDDGVRPGAQWTGPPWDTTGTAGPVAITNPTPENIGPQLGNQFCVKCHADWVAAYSWHAYDCTGCLTCHSHGMAWGANDWGGAPDDTQWCP